MPRRSFERRSQEHPQAFSALATDLPGAPAEPDDVVPDAKLHVSDVPRTETFVAVAVSRVHQSCSGCLELTVERKRTSRPLRPPSHSARPLGLTPAALELPALTALALATLVCRSPHHTSVSAACPNRHERTRVVERTARERARIWRWHVEAGGLSSKPGACRVFPLDPFACSRLAGTFDPKAAGSNPAQPIDEMPAHEHLLMRAGYVIQHDRSSGPCGPLSHRCSGNRLQDTGSRRCLTSARREKIWIFERQLRSDGGGESSARGRVCQ